MKMILNTQRKVDYDQAREYTFGDDDSLKEYLAIAILNPDDLKKLNISTTSRIKITSKYGFVVVAVKVEEDIPSGSIIMPTGIWANQITGTESNNLIYKNIEVDVEATRDLILNFDELIKKINIS